MSTDSDAADDATDELQFETAEISDVEQAPAAVAPRVCIGCRRPIASSYFAIRDKIVCPACCAQLNAPPGGSRVGRVLKAGFMGFGAGLVGALIWFVLRRAAHVEIGLVAVLVGFMVGKSVRKCSGNRGGLGYQIMAVLLTYSCIAANYIPDTVEALIDLSHKHHADVTHVSHEKPSPLKAAGALVIFAGVVFGISLAAPFIGGAQNLIGLLIIGFALWEAWKFNRPRSLAITGPYQVGAAPARMGT